jgi:glycerol-3-phosphate acyltransferase PlsY
MLIDLLLIATGYLMGSVSSAIIVCRAFGLPDPRSEGSRNPGTTNVLRLGGKKAAAATLAGDMLKGLVPVLIARAAGADVAVQAGVAVAAFLGHLYRCSSASRVARVWPPPSACCSDCTGRSAC